MQKIGQWTTLRTAAFHCNEIKGGPTSIKSKSKLSSHVYVCSTGWNRHGLEGGPQGMYALFANYDEMYLCKDDSFSWLSRCVSSLLVFLNW